MKKDKLLALESLRGIAAISVAFYHFNIGSHFNNGFIANSWLMVDFFFVLSGFVIALNYTEKLVSFSAIRIYQTKRFLRLYPLHLVMLLLFVGIEFAKYIVEVKLGMVANNPAFSKNDLPAFFANLFLIQNWTLSNLSWNYPSWSISAEFIIYGLFAVLIFSTNAKKLYISIILFLCILLSGAILSEIGMGTGNDSGGPLRCLYSFPIGVLTFFIYHKYKQKYHFKSSLPPLFFICISVYLVTLYGTKDFEYLILFPLLFGATILSIVMARKDNVLNKILSLDWLVYLGTISYGIYMIHAFVWWIIAQTMRFVIKIPTSIDDEGRTLIKIENIFIADVISILGILLVIIISHFSYKYFETKFKIKTPRTAQNR